MLKALWVAIIKYFQKPAVPTPPAPIQPVPVIPPEPVKPLPVTPPIKTMPQKIYDLSKACMGRDIAATQNELGCAESVSYIFIHCGVANFPKGGYLGTAEFYTWLKKYAVQVDVPAPGDIIISPTGTSTKGAAHGHIGVVAIHGILSNNSMNGLWQEYYTLDTWRQYFGSKLGFPTLFFRIV